MTLQSSLDAGAAHKRTATLLTIQDAATLLKISVQCNDVLTGREDDLANCDHALFADGSFFSRAFSVSSRFRAPLPSLHVRFTPL